MKIVLVAGIRTLGGKVETLEVDEPRPLAADEVLIDIRSAGVGNWDDIIRTGGWDVGTSPPLALGVEAAGVITAVGAHPSGFSVDDEVLCHRVPLRDQGTWAPFLVPALTAEQVVGEALAVHGEETLLVNGAGGITGGLIVQLAALRGVDVLATASPRSADRVRGNGAREVLDYHDPMWPHRALALAKDSINAVANAAPCIHAWHQRNRGLRPFRRRSTRPPDRATRLPSVEHADPAFLQPGSGRLRPRTSRRRPRAKRSGHHERENPRRVTHDPPTRARVSLGTARLRSEQTPSESAPTAGVREVIGSTWVWPNLLWQQIYSRCVSASERLMRHEQLRSPRIGVDHSADPS
jgi:Alcohol dehydrogenase GroES-like domain